MRVSSWGACEPLNPIRNVFCGGSHGGGDSESAFTLQAVLDLGEPPFTGPQRRRAGLHGVLAEHEVVIVRSRGPRSVPLLSRGDSGVPWSR
jgi:hypothetical protein